MTSTTTRMPAAFFGHDNPMNALETNRYTLAWRAFGKSVPRPSAILVVSAHWYVGYTAVTAMPRPRTVHDFLGGETDVLVDGYAYGSLSMTAYTLDLPCEPVVGAGESAALPAGVPTDETNI